MILNKIISSDFVIKISIFLLGCNFIFFSAFSLEGEESYGKTIIRLLIVVLLLLLILVKNKINFYYILLIPFLLIIYIINGNAFTLNFIFICLLVCILKDYDNEKLILNIFNVYVFMVLYHMLVLKFGFVQNYYVEYDGRYRSSYGFNNFNKMGMFYFYFCLLCLYFLFNGRRRVLSLMGLLVSLFFIISSDSRASIYALIVSFIVFFIIKFKFLNKFMLYVFRYNLYMSFFVTLVLTSSFSMKWNETLSYRPELFNKYLGEILSYPELFFGYFGDPIYPVDNSYLILIGALTPSIFLVFLLFSPYFFKINNISVKHLPILIGLIIFGIFENSLLRIELLLPILFFKYLLPGGNRS